MHIFFHFLLLLWGYLTGADSAVTYPRKVAPEEATDHYLRGGYLTFTVDPSDCRLLEKSTPPLRNYSFGEDIVHGRFVSYGPLSNLTYWRQRFVDNKDVKRVGPVLRLSGVEMDATGFAVVTLEDYDPRTFTRLAYLKMQCGSWKGFQPFAQTPGGFLVEFHDVTNQLSQGALLRYVVFSSGCEPRPQNLTHTYIDSGPVDEYRFDGDGNVVFTYRVQKHDLTTDVSTVKMTTPTNIALEKYNYDPATDKVSPLVTKKCVYGHGNTFQIFRIPSPQSLQ